MDNFPCVSLNLGLDNVLFFKAAGVSFLLEVMPQRGAAPIPTTRSFYESIKNLYCGRYRLKIHLIAQVVQPSHQSFLKSFLITAVEEVLS